MKDIFSPSGLLAKNIPFYEYRPEQEQMAGAVQRAMAQERFLIVEAGTGTGKTLAYLIPSVLSGKRVVVSTGTKTLQEQLFFKDVPLVQDKLRFSFRAAFMKGRGNYLCWRRFRLFSRQPLFASMEEVGYYQTVKKWAGKTKTGDRAELTDLPEDLGLWKEVCASSETCLGQSCEFHDPCFIMVMRQEAAGADILIVNHHLFFADLAVRLKGYGEVLPRYEAVVFDEAHQLEETATQYLGSTISNYRFEELARDLRRECTAAKVKEGTLTRIATDLLDLEERFFQPLRGKEARFPLQKERWKEDTKETGGRVMDKLTSLSSHIAGMQEPSEGLRACGRRAEELKLEFQEFISLAREEMVYWGEVRGRGVFLHGSPVDVSSALQENLYPRLKTAVFTSATLSTQGNFNFFRSRMGLTGGGGEGTDELILDSSFDLKAQSLLYLPPHLPEPNSPSFLPRAVEEMEKILRLSLGRAFLLFTSIRNMEEAYRRLKERVPFTCFLQGERPKTALLKAFKDDLHSVLFATASFWEGVDIQGEALSCVVIDRLPFSPPTEPILEARLERIAAAGGKPFWDYQVPSAILLLKQGLGRLIRTRQDRGILAILDTRLLTRGYGKVFLQSLPPWVIAHEPEAIDRFFRNS
ncbi:MAG TPA: ATP-dependent DNA helicase [Thermodesulfobacteriota bacterium]|nr:ATP-dependent DNA helicase [Thermodesulfobacteriota bacterium]